jgi:hypothetical protein
LAAAGAALITGFFVAGIGAAPAWAGPAPSLRAGAEHGIVFARGQAKGNGGGGSPQLLYHGGGVLNSGAAVKAVFWGPSWTNATFAGDKITGLDSFYTGIGGTPYTGTNTEYTDSTGHVGSAVSYSSHVFNPSGTPTRAPQPAAVLAVVAQTVPNPVPNGYYPVYSDIPRGHAGYCAWHSAGSINGVPVEFGFFFNLDGDPGCDPHDTSGQHSEGLSALANVSGHELSETLTDPRADAWYDGSGSENADKCAWKFSGNPLQFGNGTTWRIQGNWSNAAYLGGTSYLGAGSGCIDRI